MRERILFTIFVILLAVLLGAITAGGCNAEQRSYDALERAGYDDAVLGWTPHRCGDGLLCSAFSATDSRRHTRIQGTISCASGGCSRGGSCVIWVE